MNDKQHSEAFEKRNRKPPTESNLNNAASQGGFKSQIEENALDRQLTNSPEKRPVPSSQSPMDRHIGPSFLDNPKLKRSLGIDDEADVRMNACRQRVVRKEGSMFDDDRLPKELANSKLPTRKGRSGKDPVKALEALFDVDPTFDPIECLHPGYRQRAKSGKEANIKSSDSSDELDISRDCIDVKAKGSSREIDMPKHQDQKEEQKLVPPKEEILGLRKKSMEQSISNEEQKTRKSKKRGQRRKKTKGGEMYFIFFDANTSDCNRSIPPFWYV